MFSNFIATVIGIIGYFIWGLALFLLWKMFGDTAFGWLTESGVVPQISYVASVGVIMFIGFFGGYTNRFGNAMGYTHFIEELQEKSTEGMSEGAARIVTALVESWVHPGILLALYGIARILLGVVEMLVG